MFVNRYLPYGVFGLRECIGPALTAIYSILVYVETLFIPLSFVLQSPDYGIAGWFQ